MGTSKSTAVEGALTRGVAAVFAELAAACGKMRASGKAAAQRLTTHQLQIVERLVQAHGDDIEVWLSSAQV